MGNYGLFYSEIFYIYVNGQFIVVKFPYIFVEKGVIGFYYYSIYTCCYCYGT